MKKRIIALLLAALALLCAGCGGVKLPGAAGDVVKQAEDAIKGAGDAMKSTEDALKDMKELLKDSGAEGLLAEIEELAKRSADMSDEELSRAMQGLAAEKGFALREKSMPQLIRLCRIIGKGVTIRDRVENARDKVADAVDSVGDAKGKVGDAVDSVKDVFDK